MAGLRDIKLIKNLAGSDYLQYTLDGAGELASGTTLLKQRLAKMMLTKRGSNFFDSSYGSEIASFFGTTTHPGQVDALKEMFPVYLVKLVEDVKLQQEKMEIDGIVLEPEETVVDITLDNIIFDAVVGG
jgi:phage baseplate assembly protein W